MCRRLNVIAFCLFASAPLLVPKALPLVTNDIRLMLRSGYSSEAIQKELAARHFVGSFDETAEKSLRGAGATSTLIDGLKKGIYRASEQEAEVAEAELAAQAQRRAMDGERSRQIDILYQDRLRQSRGVARPPGETVFLADLLKNDLVSLNGGSLKHFDDDVIGNKKIIALYFTARWCGPCHKFTPKLIEFYNRVLPAHPEFEVVMFSHDRSAGEMETYMREMQIPWPAIDFGSLAGKGALKKYEGDGIPCLVAIDAGGHVISDTFSGKTYNGPDKVLEDLDAIFSRGPVATTTSR